MNKPIPPDVRSKILEWQKDWPKFARDVLDARLDADEEAILQAVQTSRRTVVRSGHGRGKDYVAGVCIICHAYLEQPSKTICTAPTHRQVINITLAEAKAQWSRAMARGFNLGGSFLSDRLAFPGCPEHFVLGFKASDKSVESWTGYHSPNIMVVVTEASGIDDVTYGAIEGLLTGNSRLLLVLNPNRTQGEAYRAFKDPAYRKFTLSSLDAPNVRAKKILIPGQVDWKWIDEKVHKPGWTARISIEQARVENGDFEWEGQWYRPGDLFRVKVMGLWPSEPEGQLIPLAWVEAANQRWLEWKESGAKGEDPLRLGGDIAGLGNDLTVLCHRHGNIVTKVDDYSRSDHMSTVGRIGGCIEGKPGAKAFIDTIGEGAGVYSRAVELKLPVVSVKFGSSAKHLTDLTGERKFKNLRAYCYWAVRDALDPEHGVNLMLPPIDELTQDLTAQQILPPDSQNRIGLLAKEDIKKTLGRSTDYGDALALTFAPDAPVVEFMPNALEGAGIF